MLGFINVYKPSNLTSNAVLTKIKKQFNIKKIGHMGTLDPMAEGVLPIAIGNATRMFDYFLNKKKSYIATFKFGFETDTLDITGNILNSSSVIPNLDLVKSTIKNFVGKFDQIPPKFSAKNINGSRAYNLARNGVEFTLPSKEIYIYEFDYLSNIDDEYTFKITCSSGTYIRSICRDLAYSLNTYATMTKLIRCESGLFNLANSISLDKLLTENDITKYLISIEKVFSFNKIIADEIIAKRLSNGMSVKTNELNGLYFVEYQNNILGVGEVNNNYLKLKTHF